MNPLDRIIRNKLNHHTEDIPSGAWEKISDGLPNDVAKPRFWPSFIIMALSISILFSGLWMVALSIESISILEQNLHKSNSEKASNPLIASNIVECNENLDIDPIHLDITNIESKSPELLALNQENNSKTIENQLLKNRRAGINIIKAGTLDLNDYKSIERPKFSESARTFVNVEAISGINDRSKVKFYRPVTFKTNFVKEGKTCPFNENFADKSVDIYFSNDYNMKSMALNDPLSNNYLGMREATESPMYSFSAGVRFGYNLNYRWNIHTGINYSQKNEKFQYIDPESNQTRIITIKDYIYLNGKIVDSTITEETVVVPGTTILKVYNKTKSIDVPILARFTIMANKNLSVSALSGIFLNIKTSYKGMILGPDSTTPININEIDINQEKAFNTQLGLSLFGGVSLAYHLTNDLDLLVEPHAKIQTQSMTHDQFALKQKINTFGLNLGLRHKF